MMLKTIRAPLIAALLLTACQAADTPEPVEAGSRIALDETITLTGTEPFWGGEVTARTFTYFTPEDIEGTDYAATRMEGLGGLSWSGEMPGGPFTLTVSEMECSDGMSDRTYPFTATLWLSAQDIRNGCAYSASRPFTGDRAP
ncbi:hypothetical protein [Altererythrobacter aquiaggeris]|uniref:hypothetical protein n=1 Tax=Aestuarierythrobacter aquiaggeris TaxID=1898396 RepID=UPI00301AD28B